MIDVNEVLLRNGWLLVASGDNMGLLYKSNFDKKNKILVTFDSLSEFNHRRDKITADKIAKELGSDHLHFAYEGTSWYQSAEIWKMIEIAKNLCYLYEEVILYGHSMGGYAALLLSGPLDATVVVAFAPQFSIDPSKVPFESRFLSYAKETNFIYDNIINNISSTANIYIVYDPFEDLDRKHFDIISRLRDVIPVRLPFSGHYPASYLNDIGILKEFIISIFKRELKMQDFRRSIKSGRKNSQRYLVQMAIYLSRKGQINAALDMANRAYVLNPENITVIEAFHSITMSNHRLFGISHAMIRLILKEQPSWTHYTGAAESVFVELKGKYIVKGN